MSRRHIALLATFVAALGGMSFARADTVKYTDVRFTMGDGVQVAADVYLPSGSGPFPCLVELTPYRKESRAAEGASYLPGEGFALIEVDARGTGGSGGEYDIVFSMREQRDTAEVIEQVATTGIPGVGQVCLPKVGMYGGSYSGIIQYLVASLPAPYYPTHLAAIAPQRAYGDLYRDIVYHGGMAIGSFGQIWSAGTQAYYTEPPTDVSTPAGLAAWTDHLTKNAPILKAYLANPYIDGVFTSDNTSPAFTQRLYLDSSILARIENLKVPTLHLAGWFDAFTRGQILTFQKALEQETTNPSAHGKNFLIVGPWNHGNTHFINPDQGFKTRLAEWYRFWLVEGTTAPSWLSGPRVHYYLMGTGALLDTTGEWRDADSWPLPSLEHKRYYLHVNGALSPAAPLGPEPADSYVYDPAAGTGELVSRWDNAAGAVPVQPAWDQRTDEPKGLSYTVTFDRAARLAGTINLHLRARTIGLPGRPRVNGVDGGLTQLTPPYLDTDFVVKISDVAPDGTATLITQGYLRASHRDLDPASSEFASNGDVARAQHFDDSGHMSPPSKGADTAYDIEIWPTAKTFEAGHGLRLDIYSADTPGHLTLLEPVINTVLHSAGAESYLTVPVLPA